MNYSVSKITLYLECPFKFKKYYIDKIPQDKSKYLSFGLSIEDVIEHVYNNSEQYADNFTDSICKELIEEYWICNQYKKEYDGILPTYKFLGFTSKPEEARWKEQGFQYLKEYFTINKIEPQVGFEIPISVQYKGRTFNGRIDHIKKQEDKLILIDNKVSDKIIYNIAESLQLGFYLYAIRVLKPRLKITHVGYYYIKLNKLSIIPVEKVNIKSILNTINSVCEKIEKKEFDKSINSYCYFCQFKHEC